jgi:hypothetical protein
MEAPKFSETPIRLYQTRRRRISEGRRQSPSSVSSLTTSTAEVRNTIPSAGNLDSTQHENVSGTLVALLVLHVATTQSHPNSSLQASHWKPVSVRFDMLQNSSHIRQWTYSRFNNFQNLSTWTGSPIVTGTSFTVSLSIICGFKTGILKLLSREKRQSHMRQHQVWRHLQWRPQNELASGNLTWTNSTENSEMCMPVPQRAALKKVNLHKSILWPFVRHTQSLVTTASRARLHNLTTIPASDTNISAFLRPTDCPRGLQNTNSFSISTKAQILLEVSRVTQGTKAGY